MDWCSFSFFISFLAGFGSSNRTTALNLEHFPILLVYSHIGQLEIRIFATETQYHGRARARGVEVLQEPMNYCEALGGARDRR